MKQISKETSTLTVEAINSTQTSAPAAEVVNSKDLYVESKGSMNENY